MFLSILEYKMISIGLPVKVWSHNLLKTYHVRIEAQTCPNITHNNSHMIYTSKQV